MTQRIFVVSRFKPFQPGPDRIIRTFDDNIARARELCRDVIKQGHAPFAPHLLYTQFLDDSDPIQRAAGFEAAHRFLETCHEIWVDGLYGRSEGMERDIQAAYKLGIPVISPARTPWISMER